MKNFQKNTSFLKVYFIIALVLAIIIDPFFGCQKNDQNSVHREQELQQYNADKAAVRLQIQKKGMSITVPIHQKMDLYLGDINGNRIASPSKSMATQKNSNLTGFVSACDGDYANYGFLNSFTLITDCVNGYEISFNTTISSDNNIVAVNPFNSAQKTKGTIRVLNPSNVLVYSNLSIGLDASTNPPIDLGPDPSTPGNEFFSVTFTSGWVSQSIFDPSSMYSYTMNLGAFYESDCSDLEHDNAGVWASTYSNFQYPHVAPLNRVDPVWPVSVSNPFQFFGEDPLGNCSMLSYQYPDLQEILYSTDNGSTWIGATASAMLTYIYPPGGPYANLTAGTSHYSYVDPYGGLELNVALTGHGTVLFKNRNIVFSSPPPGGVYPIPAVGSNCSAGLWSVPVSYTY
ncbi:MAG TPA: hypothetical protein VIJ75_22680 [Hanamia sp.]